MRKIGRGCKWLLSCNINCWCHEKNHKFGCGFIVRKRLSSLISGFTPVNDRQTVSKKNDVVKEIVYSKFEEIYVIGDFNATVVE